MAIPASQIVTINPRLLASSGTDLEFNGLFLTTNKKIPSTQIVLPFPDPDAVAAYFGNDSVEYQAAVTYFLGYDNSFKKPRAIYFAYYANEDRPAYIRGGSFGELPAVTLMELKKITNGSLSLTIGPGAFTATGLDFSNCKSMSEVALKIQDAIIPPTAPATSGVMTTASGINVTPLVGINDGAFLIKIDGKRYQVSGIQVTNSSTVSTIATDIQYKLGSVVIVAGDDNSGTITFTSATSGANSSVEVVDQSAIGTDLCTALFLRASDGATSVNGTDPVYPYNRVYVEYSSLYDSFIITSSIVGSGSGVSYASGNIAETLLLTDNKGAILSPGIESENLTTCLSQTLDLTQNFVCFTTCWQATQDEASELAQWSTSRGVNYLYIFWDSDEANLQQGRSTIADYLTSLNVSSTCAVYNSIDYAAMIMGSAASIDWERRQGTITFAFKSQNGLPANIVTGVAATNLVAKNINFMGDYATRNDNFIFMYPGSMFGSWRWIDTYLNAVWLVNAIQVSVMAGLKDTPRVPYNDEGYTLVRAWIMDVLNRALYNGVIDPGVSLSESIKAELYREAGEDITADLNIDGFFLQIVDAQPQVRAARQSPEISLWYTYAGSIHKINIASTIIV